MIYIFFAQGFEEIEAITPLDIIRRAELPIVSVGIGGREIKGSHGITVQTDVSDSELLSENFDTITAGLEGIILPGGMPGTLNLEHSPAVQNMIDSAGEKGALIAAICAAPSILGHKGLLKGKKACCFPGFEDALAGAEVLPLYTCRDGNIITAAGAGAAVDFALLITEYFCGKERSDIMSDAIRFPYK